MPRVTLHRIADAISDHVLREVGRCGAKTLWYDYQPIMKLIQQYGAQRERDGIHKAQTDSEQRDERADTTRGK